MRVERLELSGFGPFEDAVFDFGPEPDGEGELVLFEGPNGSGKTCILQALALAAEHRQARPDADWHGRLAERARARPTIGVGLREGDAETRFTLAREAGGTFRTGFEPARPTWGSGGDPVRWAAFAYRPHGSDLELETTGPAPIEEDPLSGALSFGRQDPATETVGQQLINTEYARLQAVSGANHDAAAVEEQALRRFERLASIATDRVVRVSFQVRRFTPIVSFDGEEIPARVLGDGPRSMLSWLGDLYARLERTPWELPGTPFAQPFWLILDEVDEGLHPSRAAELLPALRDLFPRARIYASTHSPFVVASVTKGTIFTLEPGKDHRVRGAVRARQLGPGKSVPVVSEEYFGVKAGFIDPQSRAELAAHKRDVARLVKREDIDWAAFLVRRARLMAYGDEMSTAVALAEFDVMDAVDAKLRSDAAAEEE